MSLTDVRVDGRAVAIARVCLGVSAVLNAFEVSSVLQRIAQGRLRMPVLEYVPDPTAVAVNTYLALAVLAGVALAAGFWTPVAAAVTVLAGSAVLLWDQQTYSNHRLLVVLLTVYLIFAQSDEWWSVRRRSDPARDVPWWPQLLMMSQLSFCYLFAALSKLNATYLDGGLFAGWIWPDLADPIYRAIAIASVATEFFLAVGLWFPHTRMVAAGAGIALHASIVVLMAGDNVVLLAFALACVPLYALFITRPSLGGVASGQPRARSVGAAAH